MKPASAQLDLFQPVPARKFRRGEFKHLAFRGPTRRGCLDVPPADPNSPVSLGREGWVRYLKHAAGPCAAPQARAGGAALYVPVTRKVSPINGTETGPANG